MRRYQLELDLKFHSGMENFLSSVHNLNHQVWSADSVFATAWRLCINGIHFQKFVCTFGWLSHLCKLRSKIYDRFTVSRSYEAFKTFVTLITFRWQATYWHFWKTSVGYSGFSRFIPMFSQPWAALLAESWRSGFSYGVYKGRISSW